MSSSFIELVVEPSRGQMEKHEFSLKFTIAAIGFDKMTSHVRLSDLLEAVTCLIGRNLSRVYLYRFGGMESLAKANWRAQKLQDVTVKEVPSEQGLSGGKATLGLDAKSYIYDMNSEFYRVLFRGGVSSELGADNCRDW